MHVTKKIGTCINRTLVCSTQTLRAVSAVSSTGIILKRFTKAHILNRQFEWNLLHVILTSRLEVHWQWYSFRHLNAQEHKCALLLLSADSGLFWKSIDQEAGQTFHNTPSSAPSEYFQYRLGYATNKYIYILNIYIYMYITICMYIIYCLLPHWVLAGHLNARRRLRSGQNVAKEDQRTEEESGLRQYHS